MSWKPSASCQNLQTRAEFLRQIRDFFFNRHILEVDPPQLMSGINNDPFIEAFSIDSYQKEWFLQTSPEFAMKRLLACYDLGPIYYLGKAFRKDEKGSLHNPEFSILEWYRPGWDDDKLIEECVALMQELVDAPEPKIKTYSALFASYGLDPHKASVNELKRFAKSQFKNEVLPNLSDNAWLDFIFMQIEQSFEPNELLIVKDFPKQCAQLARVREHPEHGQVAARFEIYYQGLECGNGYYELCDESEQRKRFEKNNLLRELNQSRTLPLDEAFLAALRSGLPEMSGVAIGVDRLLMIKCKADTIREVIPFCWE